MKINLITKYLDYLIPKPRCELNYNKDYELLIAVMLSAQTTDKRVNKVTKILFDKYNDLKELKSAKLSDIELIVRELGNYHKKALAIIEIAKIVDEIYNGKVPNKRILLEELPMVGRKTTNVVLSELFNEPNIAVDTHVERVSKRLGLVEESDNPYKIEIKLRKIFPKERWNKTHKQFVLFGRYYCTARNPKCNGCKLKNICKEQKK